MTQFTISHRFIHKNYGAHFQLKLRSYWTITIVKYFGMILPIASRKTKMSIHVDVQFKIKSNWMSLPVAQSRWFHLSSGEKVTQWLIIVSTVMSTTSFVWKSVRNNKIAAQLQTHLGINCIALEWNQRHNCQSHNKINKKKTYIRKRRKQSKRRVHIFCSKG